MSNIVSTIKALPNLLALTPAANTEISDAETQLRLRFADEYKAYMAEFGAALADGIELTGIAKSEHRNVVSVTKQEWKLNPQVAHNLYVVENVGIEGIIIWQSFDGTLYQTTPNGEPVKVADSLESYLLQNAE
jgi:hypothetical protein